MKGEPLTLQSRDPGGLTEEKISPETPPVHLCLHQLFYNVKHGHFLFFVCLFLKEVWETFDNWLIFQSSLSSS